MNHATVVSRERVPFDAAAGLCSRPFRLSLRNVVRYLRRSTPVRILQDEICEQVISSMSGTIIEIGSSKSDNYSRFASAVGRYECTNIDPASGCRLLDAMEMDLADDSVDNFVCLSTLEHIPDPQKAVDEMYRTLKPSGLVLITYPFMFPFHGAPSDYSRYTYVGLAQMFRDFRIEKIEAIGNIGLTMSLFLHRPFGWNARTRSIWGRLAVRLMTAACRLFGLMFLVIGAFTKRIDGYECLYAVLARKSP